MGWCSATVIFDQIAKVVLSDQPIDKRAVLKTVIKAFEDGDWDCQQDSDYWDDPIVQSVMRELHPHWFEEQP
jgi:hypothetical protein